jgi:hypothetical protein
MVAHLPGQLADDNDNDPVEVRHYQIIGSGLSSIIGFPTTRIHYEWNVGVGYTFWQYFEHGIIISGPDTCACVLYGPIYEYWAATGQFRGPLGRPATDVLRMPGPGATPGLPPPPPTPAYAVFEHGVLFLDTDVNAQVEELSPLGQSLVASSAGVEPTGAGIAAAAQRIIQDQANQALATDADLRDNVDSISVHVRFVRIGPGGCSGAGFNAVGRSLLHSHILAVHFDFGLSGCAGAVGDASADVTIEVRLDVNPPSVTARLIGHHIDAVSSPFGAGDGQIRDALNRQLNGTYGRNLLNSQVPSDITILGAIVEQNGDVNLFMAPICATKTLMAQASGPAGAETIGQMRKLRDVYLKGHERGADFIRVVDAVGPVLVARLRQERDANELRARIDRFLVTTFNEEADLGAISERIRRPAGRIAELIEAAAKVPDPEWISRAADHAIDFVRDEVPGEETDLDRLFEALDHAIDQEIRSVRHESDDRRDPESAD